MAICISIAPRGGTGTSPLLKPEKNKREGNETEKKGDDTKAPRGNDAEEQKKKKEWGLLLSLPSQQLQPPRQLVHLAPGPQHREHRPRPRRHLRPPRVGDDVRGQPQPARALGDGEQRKLVVDAQADLGGAGALPGAEAVVAGLAEPLVEADGLWCCYCF